METELEKERRKRQLYEARAEERRGSLFLGGRREDDFFLFLRCLNKGGASREARLGDGSRRPPHGAKLWTIAECQD